MPPELIRWARAQVAALSADERALILAVAATLIAALTDESLDDLDLGEPTTPDVHRA